MKEKVVLIIMSILIVIGLIPVKVKAEPLQVIDYTTETVTEKTTQTNEKSNDSKIETGNDTLNEIVNGANDNPVDSKGNVKKVDADQFFNRIYRKMFEGTTALQRTCLIITIIFLIVAIVGGVITWFTDRKKVGGFIIGALICMIAYVGISYAPQIMISFKAWFTGN